MALQFNDFDAMVNEMNGDINEVDIEMSQILTQVEENIAIASQHDWEKEAMDEQKMDQDGDGVEKDEEGDGVEKDQEGDEMDSEGEGVSDIPFELLEQYYKAMDEILPTKSGNRYIQAYEVFQKWQASHGTVSFDEKVVMAYFCEAGEKYKPSTLWSMYSMLKKTLIWKHNIDLKSYCQLNAWLKNKSEGFVSKQSNVFTAEEINQFVVEAPNVSYLGMKAVLGFGLIGACRGDELTNLMVDNVTDTGKEIIVNIPITKTKTSKMYVIDCEFTNIIRKYIQLRPPNAATKRFFLQYRNGKCVNQVMGKHSIAKIPKEMAKFLKLPHPETYTGYSYRRSSTTIAADAGASIEDMKRLGSWKSASVCEKYIQNSVGYKRKIGKLISGAINLPSTSKVYMNDDGATYNQTEHEENITLMSSNVESLSRPVICGAAGLSSQTLKVVGIQKSSSQSVASDVVTSLSQSLKTVGIRIPDNKENIIFHFGGECSKFTIINMK